MKKLLIANRGEIALRIIKTCKRIGIKTIAVYSDADRNSLHVSLADESFHLGEADSKKSYLDIGKIVSAAKAHGADAVHPGYGFLAENPAFAKALDAAGIKFVGPKPKVIELLGDKVQAKNLAKKLKIPILPSIEIGAIKNVVSPKVKEFVKKANLPLLIKAAAGGGGRGMRRVYKEDTLQESLESASREAEKFFGSGALFIEKLLEEPRHIEVQIFGDKYGNVVHLFDRDCSLQRHHQKIVEEAPAPNIPNALRTKIWNSAVKLAKHAKYEGAGTVEFLIKGGKFYFLEVNSRLQVEHPITEEITGLDLVELQLKIASGFNLKELEKLPLLSKVGSALECRLCAESPEDNFIASTGRLVEFSLPASLRVDSGFRKGDLITHYYDSLLSKLIVKTADRAESIRAMSLALNRVKVAGVRTNLQYLKKLISNHDFQNVKHHTQLGETLVEDGSELQDRLFMGAAFYLLSIFKPATSTKATPWNSSSGWRQTGGYTYTGNLVVNGRRLSLCISPHTQDTFKVFSPDSTALFEFSNVSYLENEICYERIALKESFSYLKSGNSNWIISPIGTFEIFEYTPSPTNVTNSQGLHNGEISSPLPGKIIDVKVSKGASVNEGEVLIIIESMKMEHPIRAPMPGRLRDLMVKKGDTVQASEVLGILEHT